MSDHDEGLLDSVAALALGILPAAQSANAGDTAASVAAHVEGCEGCRRLYAHLRATADLVGYSAEATQSQLDQAAAARLKLRVLEAIARETASSKSVAPSSAPTAGGAVRRWVGYTAVAASIALATFETLQNVSLRTENGRLAQLASIGSGSVRAAHERELDTRIALLLEPEAMRYTIPGGEVVATGSRILIALRALPPPPRGKTYQAWSLARGATTMTPGSTFRPDSAGIAVVEISAKAGDVSAVAVSVEPVGGSKAPTSKPTFVRKLS